MLQELIQDKKESKHKTHKGLKDFIKGKPYAYYTQ